jgi:hypothetical protein
MAVDSHSLRSRILRAFEASRADGYASLTILELVEYVRITWPVRVPSHENMADIGVSPARVYLAVRNGPYRLVYRQEPEWTFLIPSWQPE